MVLYNAHRPIRLQRSWRTALQFRQAKDPWAESATPEIKQWVEEFIPPDQADNRQKCLRNPVKYFSRPANVPLYSRKQIYLYAFPSALDLLSRIAMLRLQTTTNRCNELHRPDFTLTLIRTPHLPPKYAQFWVPLWFNKLDLKDYLRRVYDVEVLHVRSFVVQQKVERKQNLGRGLYSAAYGPLFKPGSKKKMTAELVKPFVWPEEVTDFSPYVTSKCYHYHSHIDTFCYSWEKDTYYGAQKESYQVQEELSPDAVTKPMKEEKIKSIAEQAQDLLNGKTKWRPSWEHIPVDAKALGHNNAPSRLRLR